MSMISRHLRGDVLAVVAAAAAWLAAAGPLRAETYGIDKEHTNVSFSWDHLGISRQSGRMVDCEGTLEFDPASPESAKLEVTLKVASLWTGVAALDRQLRSPDYFDLTNHPVITFKSTDVRKSGDKTGEVTGDLTLLGQSKQVTLKVTWNFTGEHPLGKLNPQFRDKVVSGFTAETTIKRSDWGIKRFIPLASDEIEIRINTELLRK